jgi:hypothetical protein
MGSYSFGDLDIEGRTISKCILKIGELKWLQLSSAAMSIPIT